jgi:hypothetical protein
MRWEVFNNTDNLQKHFQDPAPETFSRVNTISEPCKEAETKS